MTKLTNLEMLKSFFNQVEKLEYDDLSKFQKISIDFTNSYKNVDFEIDFSIFPNLEEIFIENVGFDVDLIIKSNSVKRIEILVDFYDNNYLKLQTPNVETIGVNCELYNQINFKYQENLFDELLEYIKNSKIKEILTSKFGFEITNLYFLPKTIEYINLEVSKFANDGFDGFENLQNLHTINFFGSLNITFKYWVILDNIDSNETFKKFQKKFYEILKFNINMVKDFNLISRFIDHKISFHITKSKIEYKFGKMNCTINNVDYSREEFIGILKNTY